MLLVFFLDLGFWRTFWMDFSLKGTLLREKPTLKPPFLS